VVLYIIASTHLFQGYYMTNSFKQIGFQRGFTDSTLTVIGSFGALFNGTCKIFLASSLDYLPFKPVYSCILGAVILSLIAVHFCTSTVFFGACIWINFMGDGSMTSMLPAVTLAIFGTNRGTQVYGFMFSVFGLAAVIGLLFVEILQPKIDYNGMLVVCLMFSSVAALFTYFYRFD
jgi:hypothetical protein